MPIGAPITFQELHIGDDFRFHEGTYIKMSVLEGESYQSGHRRTFDPHEIVTQLSLATDNPSPYKLEHLRKNKSDT